MQYNQSKSRAQGTARCKAVLKVKFRVPMGGVFIRFKCRIPERWFYDGILVSHCKLSYDIT